MNKEINDTLEYLNYYIDKLCDKHNMFFYSKETPHWKEGIVIYKEFKYFVISKQFNGYLMSKEKYFKNKEHCRKVYLYGCEYATSNIWPK